MSRILLADDSPHAQRMGERILREEGFEVVTVTDGQTALMRLADVDPDVVFADISLPRRSGYEICMEVKSRPGHRHVRVILTAGLLEPLDERMATSVKCDGIIKKPFESSVVLDTIRPLLEAALKDRGARGDVSADPGPVAAVPVRIVETPRPPEAPAEAVGTEVVTAVVTEEERVRAAVTLALDAAMPVMVDRITEQVLIALRR